MATIEVIDALGVQRTAALVTSTGAAPSNESLSVVMALDQSPVSVFEAPVIYTGAAAQTAVVNNILEAVAGSAGTNASGFRSASVQVVSTGTGGTFIFEQSNDNVNWRPLPVVNAELITGVLITGAITATASQIIYSFPLRANYLRLRIASTITGGSIQAFTRLSTEPWTTICQNVAQQTGANFVVNANVTAGTSAIGDVGIQYRANATGAASVAAFASVATTAPAQIKASAGRLLGYSLTNHSAALRSVKLFNIASPTMGTSSALFQIDLRAGETKELSFEGGIAFSTAISRAVTSAFGATDNTGTGLAANDVTGFFVFA